LKSKEAAMGRILVVDDSIFARLKICGMLREAGH
jgi:hypothetical protein